MNVKNACLAIAACVLAACQTSPNIKTESTPGATISAYETYEWIGAPPPFGFSSVAYERVRQAVEKELQAKGYTAASPGQLTVIATVGGRDRIDVTSWGPFYRDYDVRQYTEGKLAVDVFDTRTKQAVWHGQATQNVDPDNIDSQKLDVAVASLMAEFPSRR